MWQECTFEPKRRGVTLDRVAFGGELRTQSWAWAGRQGAEEETSSGLRGGKQKQKSGFVWKKWKRAEKRHKSAKKSKRIVSLLTTRWQDTSTVGFYSSGNSWGCCFLMLPLGLLRLLKPCKVKRFLATEDLSVVGLVTASSVGDGWEWERG